MGPNYSLYGYNAGHRRKCGIKGLQDVGIGYVGLSLFGNRKDVHLHCLYAGPYGRLNGLPIALYKVSISTIRDRLSTRYTYGRGRDHLQPIAIYYMVVQGM